MFPLAHLFVRLAERYAVAELYRPDAGLSAERSCAAQEAAAVL